jgi:hypothetical protein
MEIYILKDELSPSEIRLRLTDLKSAAQMGKGSIQTAKIATAILKSKLPLKVKIRLSSILQTIYLSSNVNALSIVLPSMIAELMGGSDNNRRAFPANSDSRIIFMPVHRKEA